ncbi:hypothetical protein Tco_1271762, partial [Tanacetum coccineum]
VTPPNKARKFKKHASPKLTTIPNSPEEPTRKSKRVKRPAKKSTNTLTACVIIRETLVMSLSKKKEKVTVEKRKGIDLLSEVALIEEAQYEEVRKKSLRDFHKTHPSGSGVLDVTEEESTESEAESWGKDEDDNNNDRDSKSEGSDQERDREENEEEVEDDEKEKDDEFVKTPSNYIDDEDETNVESEVKDNAEGNEDKGMDYTTNQFDDDVDVRLNEPVNTDEGFIQEEGINAEMINKTEVPVTSSSYSSDLASKFLNFLDIPHTDAEIVSPMDVLVHHEILPKEVSNFAHPVIKSMVNESLEHAVLAKESSQPKSTYEAASSLTEFEPRLKKWKTSKDAEPTKEEPEFEVADSDMPKDQEENLGNNDEEPKRKTLQQGPTQSWFMTLASSADKPLKTFDELMSTPIDFSAYIMNGLKITNLTQETLLGPAFKLLKGTHTNFAELEYDFEECYKALSEKLD